MTTKHIPALLAVVALATAVYAWQGKTGTSKERGKEVYSRTCVTCHGENGEGIKDVFPPLAGSDYLMANKGRSIDIALHGTQGEMVVKGAKYDSQMLRVELTDQEVADVLTFVRSSWGNKGGPVSVQEVLAQKKKAAK